MFTNNVTSNKAALKTACMTALILCVAVFVAFILRVHQLEARDLTIDEQFSASLHGKTFMEALRQIGARAPLPFLSQWFVFTVSDSFSPFLLRLPNVIYGALTVPVVYMAGRYIFGNWSSIVFTMLFVFSHYHFVFSREGRYYPLLFLFSVAFVASLYPLREKQNWKMILLPVFCTLCVLGAWTGALLFLVTTAPFVCCVYWRQIRDGKFLRVWYLYPIAFSVIGALLIILYRQYWNYLSTVLPMMSEDDAMEMTHNFDVSPLFLLNLFSEYTGTGNSLVMWLVLALSVIGLVDLIRRDSFSGGLFLSMLVAPFVLLWFLRPMATSGFHSQYFIFMLLPLFGFVFSGAQFVSSHVARLLSGRHRERLVMATGMLVVMCGMVVFPNIVRIWAEYTHPITAVQDTANVIQEGAVNQGGEIFYTQHPYREWLLGVYLTDDFRNRMTHLETMEQMEERPDRDLSSDVFVHYGRRRTKTNVAEFVLSERFSRVAFHYTLVAKAPNLRNIEFGYNYPGDEEEDGKWVDAHRSANIRFLTPRTASYRVIVECEESSVESLAVTLPQDGGTALLRRHRRGEEEESSIYKGYVRLDQGITNVEVGVPCQGAVSGGARMERIRFVPYISGARMEFAMPAWDFNRLFGGQFLHTVHAEQDLWGNVLVAKMKGGQRVEYLFWSDSDTTGGVGVTALHDAPFESRYTVSVNGVTNELVFDAKNYSLEELWVNDVRFVEGMNRIEITLHTDPEKERQLGETRSGIRVYSAARSLRPALAEIRVAAD